MKVKCCLIAVTWLVLPSAAFADPSFECSSDTATQIDVADCLQEMETSLDHAIQRAVAIAGKSAQEIDSVTGRKIGEPALERSQSSWAAYRDKHCDLVGAMFGGGSGSGIAIRSCRIELGRNRIDALMKLAQ